MTPRAPRTLLAPFQLVSSSPFSRFPNYRPLLFLSNVSSRVAECTVLVESRPVAASFLLASSFAASPRHTVRISASRDANHRAKRKRRISGGHVGPLRRGARHLQLQGEQVTFFSRFSSPSCCRILFKFKIKFYLCAFVIECCYIYVRIIEYTRSAKSLIVIYLSCSTNFRIFCFSFPLFLRLLYIYILLLLLFLLCNND